MFSLELETSGVALQRGHQNKKWWWLREKFLSEKDFEAALTTFCCYEYGANVSEIVQMIATDFF